MQSQQLGCELQQLCAPAPTCWLKAHEACDSFLNLSIAGVITVSDVSNERYFTQHEIRVQKESVYEILNVDKRIFLRKIAVNSCKNQPSVKVQGGDKKHNNLEDFCSQIASQISWSSPCTF